MKTLYYSYENTVGKREIARKEQFLFFPQCFYPFRELSTIFTKFEIVICKLFQFGRVQKFVVWERVKNVLYLVFHIFLYLETLECNTTSDWVNHVAFGFLPFHIKFKYMYCLHSYAPF